MIFRVNADKEPQSNFSIVRRECPFFYYNVSDSVIDKFVKELSNATGVKEVVKMEDIQFLSSSEYHIDPAANGYLMRKKGVLTK